MTDGPTPRRTRRRLVGAVIGLALLGGCGFVEPPTPEPTTGRPSRPPGTVAGKAIGDRVALTAAVDQIITARSFVVRDADLADNRLLVITPTPVEVTQAELVAVQGTVALFRYADFAAYDLAAPARYGRFEGAKILVADEVRPLG